MSLYPSDVAFTRQVKAEQSRRGSRAMYARMEEGDGWETRVTPELEAFLAERDSFYLGTASADGQPYIQHRGGPRGFVRGLDDRTLGFADLRGNRQYISLGNLAENPRAFLFFMDYEQRRRIKLWGRARVVEGDPAMLARVTPKDAKAKPERAILFDVEAWDVNCPQHIPVKLDADRVLPALEGLEKRVRELETENRRLTRELADRLRPQPPEEKP